MKWAAGGSAARRLTRRRQATPPVPRRAQPSGGGARERRIWHRHEVLSAPGGAGSEPREGNSLMRNSEMIRRRRSLSPARLLLALTLPSLLALIALAPASAAAAVSFEVKGQWLCNNRGTVTPLAGARVELWKSNSYWFDDKLGATHTAGNGAYSFSVRSGENFDLYAQVVLNDDQGAKLGEWYSFSDWSTETETTGSRSGVVNLGTYEIDKDNGSGTPKCAVWQGAHNAYQNYKQVIGSPPPDTSYSISADFPCCGTPFTTTDTTRWPSNYATGAGTLDGGYSVNFHEFAHSVRHSLDGGTAHFLLDATRFGYPKTHTLCQVSNEGFAFNEGWAEYWAGTPATCGDGTNFNQEGNVATALTGLEKCANRPTMVRVLKESPGAIHSFAEFKAKFFAIVGPRACLLNSIKGSELVESSISAAQLTANVEQQIGAQTQLMSSLSRRVASVRAHALKPGKCTKRQCVAGIEKLIEPSAVAAQIAQAKLVRERLQSGLAAARSVIGGSEAAQLKFFETLEGERAAFERANQAILISGLQQSLKAIKSKPGFAPARSTASFRTISKRLSSLTSVKSKGTATPPALATLFAAPPDPTDQARRVGARPHA
jgi:hypothetical protein